MILRASQIEKAYTERPETASACVNRQDITRAGRRFRPEGGRCGCRCMEKADL